MNIMCKCILCKKSYDPNHFISLIKHSDNKIRLTKQCLSCRKLRNKSQNKKYRELRPTNNLHHKGFH